MFGHDENQTTEEHVTGNTGQVVQPMSSTPPDENLVGVAPSSTPAPASNGASDDGDDDIDKIVDDINAADDTDAEPAAAPPVEVEDAAVAEPDELARSEDDNVPAFKETPAELMEVKKSALQELSPLLDELDQSADEKLNILMMTIQATDDQSLLPQALKIAKQIEDKKLRAEAMLDIIQEINYFTKKR